MAESKDAVSAEAGVATIHRRLYYNPEGPGRPDEFDFITYFECSDEHVATFDGICRALRDRTQNPEWQYVVEGPEWGPPGVEMVSRSYTPKEGQPHFRDGKCRCPSFGYD